MNLKEIRASAAALGNQLRAGIPIYQALNRLALMQPQYADFWGGASNSVQAGNPVSTSLADVWPPTLISSVRAGERSGKLEEVFAQIQQTIAESMAMRKNMARLIYPCLMGLGGMGVFVFFMVVVLPRISKSLGTTSHSFVFLISNAMSHFVDENLMILAGAGVAGIFLFIAWVRTAEAQEFFLNVALSVPVLKDALRDLYFGIWAHYMALMVSAGITMIEALKLTAGSLPEVMRESVRVFERDLSVNNRTMSEAADLAKQSSDDPRVEWWPFYIANAFIMADQTGEVDRELLHIAPSLTEEGVDTLNRVVEIANVVALFVAGLLIAAPLAAYYIEIFTAIQEAGH